MNIFELPKAKFLIEECKKAFSQGVWLKPHHRIIFVCGGPIDDPTKQRPQFLDYSKKNLTEYQVILAEVVTIEIKEDRILKWENIASFEERLSGLSDCILLFPESAGSIAELGYFSANPDLKKMMFVVNPHDHQGDSFINLGPISLIEKVTTFKKIIVQKHDGKWDFSPVKDRLEKNIPRKNAQHIVAEYKKYGPKEKLFITLFLIEIFGCLNFDSLKSLMIGLFGKGNYINELRLNLGALLTCQYILKSDSSPSIYIKNPKIESLVEIRGFDSDAFRLKVLEFFQTESPPYYERVREFNDAL